MSDLSFEDATNVTARALLETSKVMLERIESLERSVSDLEWAAHRQRVSRWREAQAEHDCYEPPKCPPRCDYDNDEPPAWFT